MIQENTKAQEQREAQDQMGSRADGSRVLYEFSVFSFREMRVMRTTLYVLCMHMLDVISVEFCF